MLVAPQVFGPDEFLGACECLEGAEGLGFLGTLLGAAGSILGGIFGKKDKSAPPTQQIVAANPQSQGMAPAQYLAMTGQLAVSRLLDRLMDKLGGSPTSASPAAPPPAAASGGMDQKTMMMMMGGALVLVLLMSRR